MGERERSEKIRDLQNTFGAFLWRRLEEIQQSWSEGNFQMAIWRALNLVIFLPITIKKELEENVEEIRGLMSRSYKVEAADFHTSMLVKHRSADQEAQRCLTVFMDKMLALLDQRGYLERSSFPTPKYGHPQKPLGSEEE
jgi:hypothetical protein